MRRFDENELWTFWERISVPLSLYRFFYPDLAYAT